MAAARSSTIGLAQRQLRTRFLGQEPRCRAGGGGDRDRQPLRSRRGGADRRWPASPTPISRCWRRRTGFAPPSATSPAPQRILDAIKRAAARPAPEPISTSRSRRAVLANQRALGAAAAADAGAEHQRAGDAGVAAAGKRARHRRLAEPDRHPARHAGPAVGIADAASGHPPPGGAARLRHRECRQRPRAVLSQHSADRAGRLSEFGAGRRCSSRMRHSSARRQR